MADLTYREAQIQNELVQGTPGIDEEQITGAEVIGATSATLVDSGVTFATLQSWVVENYTAQGGIMFKAAYDSNNDGIADAAEEVKNQVSGKSKTADQIFDHIEDTSIHFVINDGSVAATVAWSASKINTELGNKADQSSLDSHTGDANIHRTLNDLLTTTTNLWSASKIQGELDAKTNDTDFTSHTSAVNPHGTGHTDLTSGIGTNTHAQIDTHISTATIHRTQSDTQTTTTNLWSASKINTELGLKTNETDFTAHTGAVNPHGTGHTDLTSGIGTNTHAQIDAHIVDNSHLSTDERAAMDNVNFPLNAGNPFATMQDVTGGGATTYLELTDTPASYTGQQGKLVKVNATEDGLIFGDPSGTTVSWGDITGTLSNQTDLQAELDAKVGDGANVGAGVGLVYRDKTSTTLNFKSLAQGSGITITNNADDITIEATGGGGIPEAPDDSFGYLREGSTSNTWVRGSRVTVGLTAPTSPAEGDVWIDTA